MKTINSNFLNVEAACKHLNCSKSHLYKLSASRKIPCYKPGGKKIYFLEVDLETYMLQNRRSSTQELDELATTIAFKKGGAS